MKPKRISITRAKAIANELGYDEVIIVGAHYESGTQHVTTFGKSKAACENAAKGGNAIKKLLNWPEHMCKAKPARQKRSEERKQADVKRFRIYAADRTMMHKCDNIPSVIDWLKTRDMELEDFHVEDVYDDIEVSADELLKVWAEGERPEDLQMF